MTLVRRHDIDEYECHRGNVGLHRHGVWAWNHRPINELYLTAREQTVVAAGGTGILGCSRSLVAESHPIRAALFDACDVLYYRPREGVAFGAFLSTQGLSVLCPGDPTMAALKRRAMVGELSAEAFFESLLTHCGVRDPARAEGRRILAEEQADVEFFDGVGETLHRLKSAGFRLGVVTDTDVSVETKLRWLAGNGIDRVWDAFAASSELKVAKPDPAIYLAALESIGVPAAEACFVGHAADELDGAKAIGLTTIAFNRDDETVSADHVIVRFSDLLGVVGCR